MLKTRKTNIDGLVIIEPTIYKDSRGYFFESWNKDDFNTLVGCDTTFVQDNESYSSYGVLRGLHFQTGDSAQGKLVRVVEGTVLDVAVDLRKDSDTFGKYESVILSGDNHHQFFIPRGFAHGFVVLSPTARFLYKCDNRYNPEAECGIIWNDTQLNIDWKISKEDIKVSDKDLKHKALKDISPEKLFG